MKIFIGLEAKPYLKEIPDFHEFFLSVCPPTLSYQNLFIFEPGNLADEASDLLQEADLLEEKHWLIGVDGGETGEDFFDYGFLSNGAAYLYKDELSAFTFTGGEPVQIKMALIQLEEHLVYKSLNGIYFTPKHYIELIQGIVKAYVVQVEFLDLDK
jgi:hypothetical protein